MKNICEITILMAFLQVSAACAENTFELRRMVGPSAPEAIQKKFKTESIFLAPRSAINELDVETVEISRYEEIDDSGARRQRIGVALTLSKGARRRVRAQFPTRHEASGLKRGAFLVKGDIIAAPFIDPDLIASDGFVLPVNDLESAKRIVRLLGGKDEIDN